MILLLALFSVSLDHAHYLSLDSVLKILIVVLGRACLICKWMEIILLIIVTMLLILKLGLSVIFLFACLLLIALIGFWVNGVVDALAYVEARWWGLSHALAFVEKLKVGWRGNLVFVLHKFDCPFLHIW